METTFLTRRRNVVLLAAFCCTLWGSASPFIKMGYTYFSIETEDPAALILFAGVRFTLSGLLVLAMGGVGERKLLIPKGSSWGMIVKLCLFQTVMQYVCYYIGLAHTTSVKGAILGSTSVFFCILFASLLFHQERLRPHKLVGCAVGFAGVVLVNLSPGNGLGGGVRFLGEGMVLLAAVAYAISSSLMHSYSLREDPVTLSGWQFVVGGAIMVALGFAAGGRLSPQAPAAFAVLGYLSFLSAAAYSVWGLLLRYNPVSSVAVFGFLNPIIGVVLSALLLREQQSASWAQCIAALALVSAGIITINRPEKNG